MTEQDTRDIVEESKRSPTFNGKELVELTLPPEVDFLTGNFGQSFLEEFNGRVASDFSNVKVLTGLFYNEGIVTGGNPYEVVLANTILEREGLRTTNNADLEFILHTNTLSLGKTGIYSTLFNEVYTGLLLSGAQGKNSELAKDLIRQLRIRGIVKGMGVKSPLYIPLDGLRLRRDTNFEYELAFDIQEGTKVFEVAVLKDFFRFNYEDINLQTGFPNENYVDRSTRENIGKRGFSLSFNDKRNRGLYGLKSDECSIVCWDSLDNSHNNTRIIVVKKEVKGTKKLCEFYGLEEEKISRKIELAKEQIREGYRQAIKNGLGGK